MAGKTESRIILQERDLEVLCGMFESRVATLAHLADLYFEGRKEATKKRLQKLKSAGLIRERARKASEPALLFLTTKAFDELKQRGLLERYPRYGKQSFEKRTQVSPATMSHELAVVSAKASLYRAIEKHSTLQVKEFCTWPLLNEFEVSDARTGARVTVKPDGFLQLHETSPEGDVFEHNFFVEVDRSTESQNVVAGKAGNYLEYYRTGGFAERLGLPRDAFRDAPFRVLMLFRNEERRNNAVERLLQHNPPIRTMVWMTTQTEFEEKPLGDIWVRPHDYDTATRGTQFQVNDTPSRATYRRNTAREDFISNNVSRVKLLEE